MMDPQMDVREDRLTKQLTDEWSVMVGLQWHTDRQTGAYLHTQEHQKCDYPIVLHAMTVGQNSDGGDLITDQF